MLYTSYFAKFRHLAKANPEEFFPVAVCLSVPKGFKGAHFKKFAPKPWFFSKFREDHDEKFFTQQYKKEILAYLDPKKLFEELTALAEGKKIVLLCWEKSDTFCHRHLIAEWFEKNQGIVVKELN